MRAISVVVIGAAALAAAVAYTHRPPSPRAGSAITTALKSDGYESWGSITEKKDGWQVTDARPNGSGERYRLILRSDTYDVIERTPELAKGTIRGRDLGS